MAHESILIVDDQPSTTKLMQVMLAKEGYQVRFAANATEALQAVQNCQPDLILSDIHLPGLDGLALAKMLKTNSDSRHIKIVAITSYPAAEVGDRIAAAGCDGFIAKPIDTNTFAASIRKYLDESSPQS